ELLVGAARRLSLRVPGPMILSIGDLCGQRIFFPPGVKGWEQGLAWITTGSLMQRSNGVAVMLGLVDVDRLAVGEEDPEPPGPPALRAPAILRAPPNNLALTSGLSMLRQIQQSGWEPERSLQRALGEAGVPSRDDAVARALARELVLAPLPEPSQDLVRAALREMRESAGIAEGDLLTLSREGEIVLRRAAHLIL